MKKLITTSLVFVLILLSCANVFAASGHYKASLVTDSTTVKPGETVTVYLHVSDFVDVGDGINVAEGEFTFDSNVLTLESYTAEGGWAAPTMNTETNYFVMEIQSGEYTKEDQNILKLVFKVSDSATVGSSTDIEMTYLDLANDNDYDEEVLPKLTLTVESDEGNPDEGNPDEGNPDEGNPDEGNPDEGNPDEGNPDQGNPDQGNPDEGNPDEGNPDEGNPDEGNPDEGNPDEGNPDDGKQEPTDNTTVDKIPQAGDNVLMIVFVAGVLIAAITASIVKYKKMQIK